MGRIQSRPPRKHVKRAPRIIRKNTTCPYCTQPEARADDDHCKFCGHLFGDTVCEGRMRDAEIWRVNHPMQLTWITINREKSNFARSIFNALQEFGKPTEKQQAALDRITMGNP